MDSDGNGPGFDANATEYQIGYDHRLGANSIVGLSVGKSDADIDVDDRSADGNIDTTSFGAYARHDAANWYGSAALSYNRHSVESKRDLLLGGEAKAAYHARTLAFSGEVGKRLGKRQWNLEPHLTVKIANTRQPSFGESGPVGALDVDSSDYNSRRLGLGLRVAGGAHNARIQPRLLLAYEHEFGDTNAELTNTLAGLPSFGVEGTDLGRNIFTARLGADVFINTRFSLTGEIGASWRRNQSSRSIFGGLRYDW
jgi:outer membrane autotransporter protein